MPQSASSLKHWRLSASRLDENDFGNGLELGPKNDGDMAAAQTSLDLRYSDQQSFI